MRQRAMRSADGDFSFGSGLPFLVNSGACVAQAILTRLKLAAGEWFLDQSEGTPYSGQILGHNTAATRDLALRIRILETPGVLQIAEYMSFVDSSRAMVVIASVDTIYGPAQINATL